MFQQISPVDKDNRAAITVKIKDGRRRPYLCTDRNRFRVDTTTPLREHLRQEYEQWPQGRCDNVIVTMLSKVQFAF